MGSNDFKIEDKIKLVDMLSITLMVANFYQKPIICHTMGQNLTSLLGSKSVKICNAFFSGICKSIEKHMNTLLYVLEGQA